MDKVNIYSGDCIEKMKLLESNSIDLIVTDPPYNLNKDYGNLSDKQSFDEYLNFSRLWLTEAKRVLKDTGTIYVFMGVRYISYIYSIIEQELGFKFNSWITWHYTQGMGKVKGFSPRHDDILMFTKSDKFTFNLDAVRVPQKYYRSVNNMRGANPSDVWAFSHIHYCQENRQNHPTQKPEGLYERMVLASSNEGDTVLDCFAGSGTALRVCQHLNRKCVGIEINSDYVSMIKHRLAQPFKCFDSIDERMERIPNDLTDSHIRSEYINNHKKWFLKNHDQSIEHFAANVDDKYPASSFEQIQFQLPAAE